MSTHPSLLLQLNQATRRWHASVDEPWLELLRADVTERDYVAQLVRMYGFVAPVEGACAYTPQLSRAIEMRQLRRAGLIAQDLLALGIGPATIAALPQCVSITPFRDVPEALGWLYVVERSTLHHDQVRRHLQQRIACTARASSYLGMFDGVPDHWQRFGTTLERIATSAKIQSHVIDAAHAAFQCMEQWFQNATPRLRSTG